MTNLRRLMHPPSLTISIIALWCAASCVIIPLRAQTVSSGPLISPSSVLQRHGIPLDEEDEVAALSHKEAEVRVNAALLLVSATADAHLGQIEAALNSETDAITGINLAGILWSVGDKKGLQFLSGVCENTHFESWVKVRAAVQMRGEVPPPCLHTLTSIAQSAEDTSGKIAVLSALGHIHADDKGREEVVGTLVKDLHSDVDDIRMQACISLGELGDPRAVSDLTNQLKSERNERIRTQIELALTKLQGTSG
jgi:HEAT repeat protein